ncbi:MAG: enoyl-CoA hydratase/isomerase family protein, partial [Actinomycetota bacterium]|nr:enoyl-CoA hydratase/isomerase family protein [Actinomycetota bacterium]
MAVLERAEDGMGVQVERHDGCAVVTLSAGKVNALDLELCGELTDVVGGLPDDPQVRSVVLTGAGRAFSAGVDLPSITAGGGAHAREFVSALARCFETVLHCPLPVVAAVNGHAIAGGCVLACATDHRVVADDPAVRLGLTELAVGVPFPTSAVEIMRWRLGDPLLARRVLLADTVPAPQAVA